MLEKIIKNSKEYQKLEYERDCIVTGILAMAKDLSFGKIAGRQDIGSESIRATVWLLTETSEKVTDTYLKNQLQKAKEELLTG